MSVIVNIRHETDLSEYTSTQVDSGDLSADAAAAMAGSAKGLQCVIDDTNAIWGRKSISLSGKTAANFRYYYDPNTMTQDTDICDNLYVTASDAPWEIFAVAISNDSGYKVRVYAYDDADASTDTGDHALTDAAHYIEIGIVRATNDSSADGTLKLYIDGVLQHTLSSIDNYDSFILADYLYAGAGMAFGVPAGWDGTFFLDEIKANDDGAYIGPVAAAAGVPKHAIYYQRMRQA